MTYFCNFSLYKILRFSEVFVKRIANFITLFYTYPSNASQFILASGTGCCYTRFAEIFVTDICGLPAACGDSADAGHG